MKLTDTSTDWDLLIAWMRGRREPHLVALPEPGDVPARPEGQPPAVGGWRPIEPLPVARGPEEERSAARR